MGLSITSHELLLPVSTVGAVGQTGASGNKDDMDSILLTKEPSNSNKQDKSIPVQMYSDRHKSLKLQRGKREKLKTIHPKTFHMM